MSVTHMSRRDKAVSHARVTVPPTRPDPTRPILSTYGGLFWSVVTEAIHRYGSSARAGNGWAADAARFGGMR